MQYTKNLKILGIAIIIGNIRNIRTLFFRISKIYEKFNLGLGWITPTFEFTLRDMPYQLADTKIQRKSETSKEISDFLSK